MEVLEGQKYFRCIELGLSKGELLPLNVQHEVTTTDILHDKVHPCLCLEARMKTKQKRMSLLSRSQENALLRTCAKGRMLDGKAPGTTQKSFSPLHLIIVYDEFLLQHLDCIQAVRFLFLRQHDLTEVTFTENGQEVEIV